MTEARSDLDGAVYRPVRQSNALETTIARLMQTIRLGVVAPGNALPSERDLADRFGVGRGTVRAAIGELVSAGYLVVHRGRYGGTFLVDEPPRPVRQTVIARAELDDLLGMRRVLEVGAARAAAERAAAGFEGALHRHLDRLLGAPLADYRRLDARLHLAIAEAAGIPSLTTMIADNRIRIDDLLDAFPLLPGNIEHSDQQHVALVATIIDGRQDRASREMGEHLAGTAELLRGFFG